MPQNKIRTEDIVDSQITYAKIQNVSNNNLLLGRNTAGAGLIEELNAATAKAILALNNVENVALSTWTGSTNINTLGTITQGTWSGSTISIDKGGTGLNTLGTANQVLAVNSGGTALQYVTPLSGTGTSGQVSYWSGAQTITGSSSLVYNDIQKSLTLSNSTQSGVPRGWLMQQTTPDAAGNVFIMQKSRGGTITSGTDIGTWDSEGFDGTAYRKAARIAFTATGIIGAGIVPGTISFLTANSSGTLTSRTFLDHLGVLNHLGSVAIGAGFTPNANLHVRGSSTGTTAWTAQFHNSGGTSNSLMIRDDGNIGISTNTPNARLQVHGADTADTGWTAQFHNSGGTSNSLMIRNDGNVGIGTNAPAAKLEVDPIVNQTGILVAGYSLTGSSTIPAIDITGAWNTSGIATLIRGNLTNNVSAATSRLIDLQVSGTSQFRVLPNGTINASELVGQLSGTIGIRSNLTNVTGNYITIDNNSQNITTTTGTVSGVIIRSSYIPPSGTGAFIGLNLNHTINQSSGSGSTGITRGLLVNPSLTSAFDWRSIEWSNNSGWGLYGSGTANNYLGGNLSVGTTGSTARLVVTGAQPSGTTTWTAQFHNALGNSNSLMIRDDGNVGIGTNAPSSRLDVVGTVEFQNPSTAYDTPSFGSELLTTGAGTNWAGTSFASGYTHTSGSTAALTSAFTPLNGQIYRVVVTTTNLIFGQNITVTFGGVLDQTITSNTTITFDSRTINTSALVITPSNDFTGTVTASVKVIFPASPLFVVRASTNNTIYQQIFNSNGTNLIQGSEAGKYTTTGVDNLFQGYNSGLYNTGGSYNTFQGSQAGFFNTNGNNNVFQGYRAGYTNTLGNNNAFIGSGAGYSNTNGGANTFIGSVAGYNNTTGNWNVAIGYLAGYFISTGGTLNKLDNSILIGYDTRVPATNQTNQIVIGHEGRGLGSNTTVIGNTNTTISLIHGNLSAGETNPKNKLETSGSFGRGSLVQVSTSSYSVGNNDTWIRVSTTSGSVALTLPDPTAWIRREIMIIRTSGATVASASANVVKFAGAGTAILGADETSCTLVSDGTNWYVMSLG